MGGGPLEIMWNQCGNNGGLHVNVEMMWNQCGTNVGPTRNLLNWASVKIHSWWNVGPMWNEMFVALVQRGTNMLDPR